MCVTSTSMLRPLLWPVMPLGRPFYEVASVERLNINMPQFENRTTSSTGTVFTTTRKLLLALHGVTYIEDEGSMSRIMAVVKPNLWE